jgi:hypothetical protein
LPDKLFNNNCTAEKTAHHDQVSIISVVEGCLDKSKPINITQHINRTQDKNHMVISMDAEKASTTLKIPS